MQVIFVQDVPGVARRDQVREVKDGYARNYLLPQGLAVRATPERVAALGARAAAAGQVVARALAQAQGQLAQLTGKTVTVAARANEQGTLYAALRAAEVAAAIREQLKVPVAPGQVAFPAPPKSIGNHAFTVRLAPDLTARLTLTISPAS